MFVLVSARHLSRFIVIALLLQAGAGAHAETRPIDVERSSVTVLVYKSGLFSAFADNHVIRAPIASGTISEDEPFHVSLTVRSADLRVLDPRLSAERRADVQARMLGPEVLDSTTFPDISFASTSIIERGAGRWQVSGNLTIHGQTRLTSLMVARTDGSYRGAVTLKQRDFGIEPITVAGGAVKVKDELKVEFEIR